MEYFCERINVIKNVSHGGQFSSNRMPVCVFMVFCYLLSLMFCHLHLADLMRHSWNWLKYGYNIGFTHIHLGCIVVYGVHFTPYSVLRKKKIWKIEFIDNRFLSCFHNSESVEIVFNISYYFIQIQFFSVSISFPVFV